MTPTTTLTSSTKLERFVVAAVWCLSFSRLATSHSFLHSKSTATTPRTARTLQQAHNGDERRLVFFAPRSSSSWWNVVSPLGAVLVPQGAITSTSSSTKFSTSSTTSDTLNRTSTSAAAAAATNNNNDGFFSSFASLATLTRREAEAAVQNSSSSSSSTTSVHLRLQETQQQQPNNNNNNKPAPSNGKSNLKIHTYVDARGRIWKALNTPRDKFQAFLNYHNLRADDHDDKITTLETTTAVPPETAAKRRREWRNLWKKGQLLTERTEYLAVYPSDDDEEQDDDKAKPRTRTAKSAATKRGGFADLLHLYTQRLLSFLRDEQQDKKSQLLRWLQKEYGRAETTRLQADALQQYPVAEQMVYWKEFLEWFRGRFPYYYDRCSHCGASIREDVANNIITDNSIDQAKAGGHKTFLGYVYPLDAELKGKASRTELYQCHKCDSFTRFPRFNSAWHVMEHGRGRCGEYSMLLFRMLRALGHEARWVVDWADHVWTEVYCPRSGGWIHLDPCEAAVQENLLYQSWGKRQTYVLGFYAPLRDNIDDDGSTMSSTSTSTSTPLIEDITRTYTSDTPQEIQARRDESERQVQAAMQQSTAFLKNRLATKNYEE